MRILKWLWGFLHCSIFLSIFIITLMLLSNSKNEKEGIFKLSSKSDVSVRSLPDPLQDLPFSATKVVEGADDIANQATTLVTEATRVASDVKNKASSDIASGEALASGFIPKGCKFGTKYMCIDFGSGRSECRRFPIDDKSLWDEFRNFPIDDESLWGEFKRFRNTMEKVESILGSVLSLQSFIISGLIFTAITTFLSTANPLLLLYRKAIAAFSTFIALALFTAFGGIVFTIHRAGGLLAKATKGTIEPGFAYTASITYFTLSGFQAFMILIEVFANF